MLKKNGIIYVGMLSIFCFISSLSASDISIDEPLPQERIVLFDLGNTLIFGNEVLPGVVEVLEQLQEEGVTLGLLSDYYMPQDKNDVEKIKSLTEQYYAIIQNLDLRRFFEPVEEKVTISTEVGVFKPDQRIFNAAIKKISPEKEDFNNIVFITENGDHIASARQYGMSAIHFKPPGQLTGEVSDFLELPDLIFSFFTNVDSPYN